MGQSDALAAPERGAFLADFATRWLAAWNSHDTDEVLALLHDDIEWDDKVFWPDVINGIDGVREYTDKIWQVMPDVHFDEIGRFFDPEATRAIVLFQQEGGPPPGVDSGKRFSTHGCDIFLEFRDGKLSRYLASYEITEMMRQLDLLPERGTRLGGGYIVSLMRGQA